MHLIDEVRGFAIVMMVIYHAFYDLVVIWGVHIPVFFSPLVNGLVVFFAGLFIFISGTACSFSRSNLKRGAACLGMGLLLTLGTVLIIPQERILFGILHLLGVCMMLYPLLAPLLKRLPPLAGAAICLALWAVTYHVSDGYLGFEGLLSLSLPPRPYQWGWLFWLGFSGGSFYSADYFPLLPWLFCFLAGAFLGRPIKERKAPGWFYSLHCRPLAFVGRHTLIIYLLHQPVVFFLLWGIFFLLGK